MCILIEEVHLIRYLQSFNHIERFKNVLKKTKKRLRKKRFKNKI